MQVGKDDPAYRKRMLGLIRNTILQSPAQFVTIRDFVNDYQINDTNDELLTVNTPAHE